MINLKNNLIENLHSFTFCKIAPSKTEGVGVFAVRDIPCDTKIFSMANNRPASPADVIQLTEQELYCLDENVKDLIKSYFPQSPSKTYGVPKEGLNNLNFGFYINHSDDPNIAISENQDESYGLIDFVTIRDVKRGEELTENYHDLAPYTHDIYNQYKFLKNP